MPAGDAWNEREETTLNRLWLEGLSASQISKQLDGRSRNAVIGRLHRLGLAARSKPAAAAPQRRTTRPSDAVVARRVRTRLARIKAVSRIKEPPPPVDPLHVAFLDRTPLQCAAITDTTQFQQRCCGQPVDERGTYCAAHRALFFVYSPSRHA